MPSDPPCGYVPDVGYLYSFYLRTEEQDRLVELCIFFKKK